MSDVGEDVLLEVPVFVEYSLEVNDDGILQIKNKIWLDEEAASEISVPFYRIADAVVDSERTEQNFTHLFAIANDLTKEAERIREVAMKIEDSTENVADLFNTSFDPT
tara:strand:+ start:687 stop:1010 length:324 start_codon:yes stop_codon:yes gene_type:complete